MITFIKVYDDIRHRVYVACIYICIVYTLCRQAAGIGYEVSVSVRSVQYTVHII